MTPAPAELAPSPPGVEVCACDESIALRRELARLTAVRVEAEARALGTQATVPVAPSGRFKGVSWHPQSARWRARVLVEGRRVSLGAYLSEDEAASAVDCALRAKDAATQGRTRLEQLCASRERLAQSKHDAWQDSVAKVGTLEVQLADTRRQLITAMEQARTAERKASRLGRELKAKA